MWHRSYLGMLEAAMIHRNKGELLLEDKKILNM